MRLRETTSTIVKALGVLRDQGRAEETSTRGRWRLHSTGPASRRRTEHRETSQGQTCVVEKCWEVPACPTSQLSPI
jgi:hypothetical protein